MHLISPAIRLLTTTKRQQATPCVSKKDNDFFSDEIWNWNYEDGNFKHISLKSLVPLSADGGVAESDKSQRWSLEIS